MPSLDAALARLARTSVLLVTTDFDGTLAPIVGNPDIAEATPRSRRALSTLARQPHTHVAVVSGRALADLEARFRPGESGILLIGSHGSEFEPELGGRLTRHQLDLRAAVRSAVDEAADGLAGVLAEHKDASSALHYRTATRTVAAEALRRLRRHRRELAGNGVLVRRGKKVVELSVLPAHKGHALARLRAEVGATSLVYLGDDRTDEDAFRGLGADDVGVKVGPGPTAARLRVDGTDEVADLLARLADMRFRALRDSVLTPITDQGFLSDGRTGALVTPGGEVSWLCPGRFDRPALFASLLGGPTAGRFVVRPVEARSRAHQRYRGDSLVLETRWPSLTVVDCLVPAAGGDLGTVLVRDIVPHETGARCEIEFAPGPNFARRAVRIEDRNGGLGLLAGAEPVELDAPGVTFSIIRVGPSDVAHATVDVDAPLRLVLRVGRPPAVRGTADDVAAEWAAGLQGLALPPRWTDIVRRSVLVLRGLVHAPTGAMVAALTSSLPEVIGGERNWDYRYCWIRDAALACDALLRVGSAAEAEGFLDWLCRLVGEGSAEDLRPLYGVGGEANLVEAELGHLIGYGVSRPVRIGNAASDQLQTDVFGAVVDLVHSLGHFGGRIDERLWRLVSQMVDAVARRWHEPDAGIWEHRHLCRHHVHSKVMCWVAVDRALRLAANHGLPADPGWARLRDEIAADVLDRGWSEDAGAYTAAYGVPDLDAAALHVVLSGLLPPDHPRAMATVEAVRRGLGTGTTVYRYRHSDGLAGREGGFHICASWLVDALALVGRQGEAEALFTQVAGAIGATGLLSEMVDPSTGAALGNVPQAYSHTGLIRNALTLTGSPNAHVV